MANFANANKLPSFLLEQLSSHVDMGMMPILELQDVDHFIDSKPSGTSMPCNR